MLAAPLVAFGLTHPEGHDFLGEAKQGAILLLGVFLRPVLMVIGLIAGMILSYVALRIVVYTFSGLAIDLFATTPSSGAASGTILHAATGFDEQFDSNRRKRHRGCRKLNGVSSCINYFLLCSYMS